MTLLLCYILQLAICLLYPASQSLLLLSRPDKEEYARWLTYWLVLFVLHHSLFPILALVLRPLPEIYATLLITTSVLLSFPTINASAFLYNYCLSRNQFYLRRSRLLLRHLLLPH